jgi:hypothetical protein
VVEALREDGPPRETGTLRDILAAAGQGVFPPPDGGVTVVRQDSGRDAGVLAFTGHAVVFTDEDPEWVRTELGSLDCDPFVAALHPRFLTAFLERTGRSTGVVDLISVARPLAGQPAVALTPVEDTDHPRVVRAHRHRDDVCVWAAEGGVLVLGRGVGGRLEAAVEVDEDCRHRRLGRELASAARRLSGGEPVWCQTSPGNARAVRAFQAAGFRPVGSEALLSAP